MKNNLDLIVTFAKLWGIATADARNKEALYEDLESYDSEDLAVLFAGWAEEYMQGEHDDTCVFFEKKMDEIATPIMRYVMAQRYPVLLGHYNGISKELGSIHEVAKFIIEHGQSKDLTITKADGSLFIHTFGIYLDKVNDAEYRDELCKILIPMQMEIDGTDTI